MSMLDEIVQFAQARTETAKKILEQIRLGVDENTTLLSAAPEHPIVSADQWKDAGGTVPLAPPKDAPRTMVPELIKAGVPVDGPVAVADLEREVSIAPDEHISTQLAQKEIANREGFENKPYPDQWRKGKQLWAIGFGTQMHPNTGQPVTETSPEVTRDGAKLGKDIHIIGDSKELDKILKVDLPDTQRAALLDFIYNIGMPQFKTSTLLTKLNAGVPWKSLLPEFLKWNKTTGAGGKETSDALAERRGKIFYEGMRSKVPDVTPKTGYLDAQEELDKMKELGWEPSPDLLARAEKFQALLAKNRRRRDRQRAVDQLTLAAKIRNKITGQAAKKTEEEPD
jgi:GH24 family phage-related lysozyme (muramidase)